MIRPEVLAELCRKFRCSSAAIVEDNSVLIHERSSGWLTRELQAYFSDYFLFDDEACCGLRDGFLSDNFLGDFSLFGFRYTVSAPLAWTENAQKKKAIFWLAFSQDNRPAPCIYKELQTYACELGRELSQHDLINSLNNRVREAESLVDGRTQFISAVSHDVRSPLNNVRAILDLLHDQYRDDDARQLINAAIANCGTIASLVEDILDFSRYQAGRLTAVKECVDLGKILHKVVEAYEVPARAKNLSLQIFIQKNVRAWIDRRQVERIVGNLISNALKFTDRGGIIVSLLDVGHERCQVVIEDSGIGMNQEEVRRVFEPFAPRGHNRDGCGLGLSLCQVWAALNGAEMEFNSTPGIGTRVSLSVPIHVELGLEKGEDVPGPGELSVLIADDDRDLCHSLLRGLKAFGIAGRCAYSTEEAIGFLKDSTDVPDVVLGDLSLAGGMADLALVCGETIPLLILSGQDDPETQQRCREMGAKKFLTKPIAVAELATELLQCASMHCRTSVSNAGRPI